MNKFQNGETDIAHKPSDFESREFVDHLIRVVSGLPVAETAVQSRKQCLSSWTQKMNEKDMEGTFKASDVKDQR